MCGFRYFLKVEGDFRFFFVRGRVWGLGFFIKNGYFIMKIVFNFYLGVGGGEGYLIFYKISVRNSNYNEFYEV